MIIGTIVELGTRVQERRKELGLSQAELAERIGAARQWVGNLEQGKKTAQIGMVLDTLKALDLVIDVRTRSRTSPGIEALRQLGTRPGGPRR